MRTRARGPGSVRDAPHSRVRPAAERGRSSSRPTRHRTPRPPSRPRRPPRGRSPHRTARRASQRRPTPSPGCSRSRPPSRSPPPCTPRPSRTLGTYHRSACGYDLPVRGGGRRHVLGVRVLVGGLGQDGRADRGGAQGPTGLAEEHGAVDGRHRGPQSVVGGNRGIPYVQMGVDDSHDRPPGPDGPAGASGTRPRSASSAQSASGTRAASRSAFVRDCRASRAPSTTDTTAGCRSG